MYVLLFPRGTAVSAFVSQHGTTLRYAPHRRLHELDDTRLQGSPPFFKDRTRTTFFRRGNALLRPHHVAVVTGGCPVLVVFVLSSSLSSSAFFLLARDVRIYCRHSARRHDADARRVVFVSRRAVVQRLIHYLRWAPPLEHTVAMFELRNFTHKGRLNGIRAGMIVQLVRSVSVQSVKFRWLSSTVHNADR